MKLPVKKICSKEKIGRMLIALILLLIAITFSFIGLIPRILSVFIAVYLLTTGIIGSCLFYAIWKE